jgi:predicted nucleic-acid-binding Zn-ribbon protein
MECPKCKSGNVRSYNNHALIHPAKEEVAKGSPRVPNEIYIRFFCEDCGETYTQVFFLSEKKV